MARKTSKFMIGLFVTFGVLIGLAAIIWLGASDYFKKGQIYVTYFNESVQGLQADSSVKYRGVEVGNVEHIRVAPDNDLIEVVMKINLKGRLDRDYVAQLRAVGITGIVFVDLDQKDPNQPDQSPKLNFGTEYPIIASKPSQIKQILSGIEEVIQNIRQIDTKGISDQIKATTKGIETLVGGQKVDKILEEVNSAATHLNGVIRKMDQVLSQGKLEEVLTETRNSMVKMQDLTTSVQAELRALQLPRTGANLQNATAKLDRILGSGEIEAIFAEVKATLFKAQATIGAVKDDVESLKLNETAAAANRLIEGMDQKTNVLVKDVMVTTENLRKTLESLQVLLDRLSATPSDLLFTKPPPSRENKR
jgi:phospholipid/cholesterol/gamma-HCH transport system substrate-binding protein